MSDKNKQPKHTDTAYNKEEIPQSFSVAPGVKPFTRYKAIELLVCGLAVVLGLLYLYADLFGLALLLPLYCAAFLAITVLRWLDARALGLTGFAAMLPILCWAFLTGAVIVATAAYFLGN